MKNEYTHIIRNAHKPIVFNIGKCTTTGLGVSRALGRLGIPVF
jgi:hypothetical protein